MNSTRYDYEIKELDESSHYGRLLGAVGANKTVLELGSSTGYLSEQMTKQLGCTVYSVEIDPVAAAQAQGKCKEVQVLDLDLADLTKLYSESFFDVVLCADVLEHLRNPVETLVQVKKLLKPDGYIVASIPNISHGSIRMALMAGKFPYRSMGLLDNTHVKFFNRQLLEETFDDAGLRVDSVGRNLWSAYKSEVADSIKEDPYFNAFDQFLKQDTESDTYQFIVKAVKSEVVDSRSEELPALDVIVYEQEGALIDDIYSQYLARLKSVKGFVNFQLLKAEVNIQSLEDERLKPRAYGDHDFRSFRYVASGDSVSISANIIEKHASKSRVDGNFRRALELACQSKASVVALLSSNTYPKLGALEKLVLEVKEGTVIFARPELITLPEAPVAADGEVSWLVPSLIAITPQTAKLILSQWSSETFYTLECSAAHFCFSLRKAKIVLRATRETLCFRIGPVFTGNTMPGDWLHLEDGFKLREMWASSYQQASYLKNCILKNSNISSSTRMRLASRLIPVVLSRKVAYDELIAFSGPGASLIGKH